MLQYVAALFTTAPTINTNYSMLSCHEKKRQRRDIVTEEEYNSTLEDVVRNQFFPDLPELQKQAAVLDRRAAHDFEGTVRVRRAARRIQLLQEREQDIEAQEDENAKQNRGIRQNPRPLHLESLSEFHARVTSEDNAEFARLQKKETQQKQTEMEEKYQNSFLLKQHGEIDSACEPLASDEPLQLQPDTTDKTAKWKPNPVRNNLFFNASSEYDEMKILRKVDSTDAELMPPPKAVVPKQALIEYIPKYQLDKRIEPSQTRFPPKPMTTATTTTTLAHPLSEHHRHLQPNSDLDSIEAPSDDDVSTDLDSVLYNHRPLHMERQARDQKKKQDLNTMVPMSPLNIRDGERSPVITNLGNVITSNKPATATGPESSITGGTSSGRPEEMLNRTDKSFVIHDESDKDKAAERAQATLEERRIKATTKKTTDKLVTAFAENKRARTMGQKRATRDHATLPPTRIISSFSPAAISLLSKTSSQSRNNPFSARSSGALGSALRTSYTPQRIGSSSTHRSVSGSRRRDHAYNETPRREENVDEKMKVRSKQESLKTRKKPGNANVTTNGLLNLPA